MNSTPTDVAVIQQLSQRVIAFHPAYARLAGSVNAGIMLSQMMYWSSGETARARDGWFWKTAADWTAETTLTRHEQESARRRLRQIGVLDEERRGIPAKLYYRVNVERLIELLAALDGPPDPPGTPPPDDADDARWRQADSLELAEQERQIPERLSSEFWQTGVPEKAHLLQETTQETTPRERTDTHVSETHPRSREKDAAAQSDPWSLVEDIYVIAGADAASLGRADRGKQSKAAQRLLADHTRAAACACARWLHGQPFWESRGVDVMTVEQQMARWVSAGKPATFSPTRAAPPEHVFLGAAYREFNPDDIP